MLLWNAACCSFEFVNYTQHVRLASQLIYESRAAISLSRRIALGVVSSIVKFLPTNDRCDEECMAEAQGVEVTVGAVPLPTLIELESSGTRYLDEFDLYLSVILAANAGSYIIFRYPQTDSCGFRGEFFYEF